MTTKTKGKTLTEAAAEVFGANITSKRSQADSFGQGKSLNPGGPPIIDLGPAHIKSDEPFANFTKGVPTATPPGATPPVGAEPKKVLPHQPQETEGDGDNSSPEIGPRQDYKTIAARTKTAKTTITPGQGNVSMPWAHNESVILSADDLEAFLDEAKKAGDLDDEGKKKFVATWKDKRKSDRRAQQKAERKSVKEEIVSVVNSKDGLSEDVDAILSGETLSDEFKEKAKTVFEAAVVSRVNEVSEVLETLFTENLEEAIADVQADLEAKVDGYLTYMVEEWIKENEIAIEKGLRGEIVEDFISGLRNLFVEHYIDIPEEKVDLVTELSEKVAALEDQLNTQIEKSIDMHKQIGESKKTEALRSITEGLTQTQIEKIRSLAESVDFTTDEEFTTKLTSIKESYFPSKVKVASRDSLNDETILVEDTVIVPITNGDPTVLAIASSLSRMTNR